MELMIRPMHDSETGAVAQLFHDVWHETQAPLQDTRKAAGRDLQFFMARIALRAARTQVAVVHGKIEGFFSWTDNRLDSLFVSRGARSMGIALTSCIVPAAGRPTFAIGDGDMEVGIGIHGEPGRERMPLQSADEITDLLSSVILRDLPFVAGDRVIVMVNGMGGTPLIELYIVFRHLATVCDQHQLIIERNLIGNYITSLEMAGCSITLLKVDDELLRLWDAPVLTPALRW